MDIVNEINSGHVASRPLARIIVTSIPEDPPPWFLVMDTGNIREQFIADTVQMLFGRQPDGSRHTWKRGILN